MKNKILVEWLQELPSDYELCLSEYVFVEHKDETTEESDFYTVILDKPIIGLAKDDENKEIRFLLTGKDISVERGDYIKDIIKET